MKRMKLYSVLAVAVLFVAFGCKKNHDYRCEIDTTVLFQYVDQNGGANLYPEFSEIVIDLSIYDTQSGEELKNHLHRGDNQILDGYFARYVSPEICDRTFSKIRGLMTLYFKNNADGKYYYMIDTIDAELEYLALDVCLLKSYSLNGVPLWRRDTCQTDYSRNTRFCHLTIDPDRFVEREY